MFKKNIKLGVANTRRKSLIGNTQNVQKYLQLEVRIVTNSMLMPSRIDMNMVKRAHWEYYINIIKGYHYMVVYILHIAI